MTTIRLSHSIFREIGMKLGESKCAYKVIEKGEIIEHVGPIVMDDVIVNPMKTGECYKYLWKNIRKEWKTSGQANKSAYNKHIAHNAFAAPVQPLVFSSELYKR